MAPTPSTEAASTLTIHPFPRLPIELRTMIWNFGARQVRVVEIEVIDAKYKGVGSVQRLTSKTIVPGILHACAESREVGLKRYEKIVFQGIFTGSYINWDIDYIGFKRHNNLDTHFILLNFRFRKLQNLEEIIFMFPTDSGILNQGCGNINLAPMTTPGPRETPTINACTNQIRLTMMQERIPGFQNLIAMRSHRELEIHKSLPEDTGRGVLYPYGALVQTKPELPRRANFKSHRLPELRNAALSLGLNGGGRKKDLLARLGVADKARFAEEMRVYQHNMLEYSAKVEKMILKPKKPRYRNFVA
ncbi:hypothetical protein IFR05_004307 [Cadophora sp. M221]|nr:hypothetical protein IFR05_004307 [Cadophora sp. M221]